MPEDRLSSLPDDLLISILHDLPLKQAVRTSAISRRWAPMWLDAVATSPVLDFTDRDFVRRQNTRQAAATVNLCLELHKKHGGPLDVLRVALQGPLGATSVFRQVVVGLVVDAVARGAKEVDVNLTPPPLDAYDAGLFLELPGNLFLAKNSLTRLALDGFSLRAVLPDAPGLAGLQSLSLSHVAVSDEAVQAVLSSCRLLEFLSLRCCHLPRYLGIAGEKLQRLELVLCPAVWDIRVAAPALESFTLHCDVFYGIDYDEDIAYTVAIDLGATPALRDAYLSHLGFGNSDVVSNEYAYSDFLSCIAHAQTLTLCSVGLLDGYDPTANIDMTNMQELQLLIDSIVYIDIKSMSSFFELSPLPLLDRLFVRLPGREVLALTGEVDDASIDIHDDDFVLDLLRFIKVVNFRGTRSELVLLAFLMKRAPALEQLVLVTLKEEQGAPGDAQTEEITQGRVSAMQKAFPEVHVTLCRASEDRSQNPAHTKLYHNRNGLISELQQ